MAERSSTYEPFDCKTPPNEIGETLPTLEPFVFTLDPQNVEEALEDINKHILNSAKFWREVCSRYHQTFLDIRAEVDQAKILEEPLDVAKIEQKLSNLEPPQEIPHVLHIITQPKMPKITNKKKSNKRSAETLIEQMYKEYEQTDLIQDIFHLTLPPSPEMELKDISQEIAKITGHCSNIEKFSMRNAYVIGTWLEAAFTKFEENKANRLSGNFEDWLNANTHFKKSKANDLRNFAKLANTIPKILNCNLPVTFFTKNFRVLMKCFHGKNEAWNHSFMCHCQLCSEYFNI